jgi:hypothetical protein
MQKYPIGIQDFGEIINGGYVYVDKTKYIDDLVSNGKPYFLSRPRRFGKSLLISTLDELFKGNKDLFKDTYIYDKWNWSQTNPVIRISFSSIGANTNGLLNALSSELDKIGTSFKIELKETQIDTKFKELVGAISGTLGKVVILIDEYDKPIIDYLGEDNEKANENREILKRFYSVLKDADANIRLLFITGISKFTKVSIFSDLNHLKDLTIHANYGGLCGITEDELEAYFPNEIKELGADKIKEWYNGYTWDRRTRIYNPFSLLNFFDTKEFQNYWYQSGHPTFLWKLLKKVNVYDLENIEVDLMALDNYDIENLDYIPLLYQTGYITFGEELAHGFYQMKFPNREVEQSFNRFLWKNFRENISLDPSSVLLKLKTAFRDRDFDLMREQLNILFASLPYHFMAKEKEVIFHAIIHLTFSLMGEFVLSEVHTHKGRCDALAIMDDAIFCFEFKLGQNAKIALDQIHDKGYLDAYKNQNKTLYAVGVNYNNETRMIDNFLWEVVV